MCAGGQGGCITSFTDCCQFYDVVTRMCIATCPAGSINATDYTCGTYTSVFELNNNNIISCIPQIPVLAHLVKIKERVQLCQV